ncbi:MAG: folylpolyglutamate synthase/dihydrofolate synthase family protein [Bacteroidales bacterium]|jgi:dihydrofolate synthase/folylpolyglutamate synthase
MTYKETLDYLNAQLPMYHRVGAAAYRKDLDNTWAICKLLGDPQNTFRSIHIGGTNGKGSTSHMLASILHEKKLKVGLYTSPHLIDFRERIRINGIKIPEENVIHFVEKYKSVFEKIKPSFFEMTVGLAFDFFREEKVDIAVIEVGLGGRLDSTNVITPLLSVITNISYDHKQLLGDTLEKIAIEKAGIIKQNIPVVIGETQNETRNVFIDKANKEYAEILFADNEFTYVTRLPENRHTSNLLMDIFRNRELFISDLESPLSGNYQKNNIVTVCASCSMIPSDLCEISPDDIKKGILHVIDNTGLAGRWQILSKSPLIICDTGHNEAGLKAVMKQIQDTPHKELHFVFGMVNDKETGDILKLLPKDAIYYFCKADIPRGLDAKELQTEAKKLGLNGESYTSVNDALETAQKSANVKDLIFIGGSTFVVAEVIDKYMINPH